MCLSTGSGRSPEGREWQSTPVFLPGKCHGQRSPACYSPWGPKSLPTTSVNRISETWAVRSPSPGTKGRRRRGGATSALCPVSSASGKYVCLLSTKRHPEFLLQSGPQHWLGEPGLACPAPRLPPLHGCALSHSGTKWNIRVLHTSQGSPPA